MANSYTATGRGDGNAALRTEWLRLGEQISDARDAGDERRTRRLERQRGRIEHDFAKQNWALAVSVAKKYFPHGRATAENSDDYVSAALLGLWEAFLEWDPQRGSLSHWAHRFMEGTVNRAFRALEAPEISYGDHSAKPRVLASKRRLEAAFDRQPTYAEIAADSGETVTLVGRVLSPRPVSLDVPVGDEGRTFADVVADQIGDVDEVFVDFSDPMSAMRQLFDRDEREVLRVLRHADLSATELWVLVRHLGLDGAPPESLVKIGDLIDKGRQTVQRHSASAEAALTRSVVAA